MIKINDKFTAKAYNRGWELHHTIETSYYDRKAKEQTTGTKSDITYYATFELLCNAVIDKEIACADSLNSVKMAIEEAKNDCVEAIKKVKEGF